jgi:IS30 family transposase
VTYAAQARIRAETEMDVEVLIEDIEFLISKGTPADEIALRLGASRRAIARRLARHGRSDLHNYMDI